MSVNKVILLGNVGRDPEVRYPSQGQTVATFPLATSDRAYTTSSGTQVPERTEWHNIVMWGRNAEIAEKYIRKGSRLYIEERLRIGSMERYNAQLSKFHHLHCEQPALQSLIDLINKYHRCYDQEGYINVDLGRFNSDMG